MCGLETFGPTQGPVIGSCERDNELHTRSKISYPAGLERASQEQQITVLQIVC